MKQIIAVQIHAYLERTTVAHFPVFSHWSHLM